MSSTWGDNTGIRISIFGGSHTEAIGVNIEGLPAGEKIDMDKVLVQMSRRAPGQDKTATKRKESDEPHIISGMLDGVLTGAPLCAVIYNTNQHSKDYSNLKIRPRPGHADYTAWLRYNASNDIRGGGHFSGRLTAPYVFAGAVLRQLLEKRGVTIGAHAAAIAGVGDELFDPVRVSSADLNTLNEVYFPVISSDKKAEMYEKIEALREKGDSAGGIIECAASGVPAGLGDPMFGGVENLISSAVFAIPAVKGIEFGAGFGVSGMSGSENNDEFYYDENGTVKTRTNNCGGILGGITNGMPIIFRCAVKPTPSIGIEQNTVNLETGENDKLIISGRHDPCIVPRAVPVVEAAMALALAKLIL